jgi:dTDP-4-amino-4,6-dideoxygalactose transaminase
MKLPQAQRFIYGRMALIYPIPVHMQRAYAEFRNIPNMSVTQKICTEILSLPLYPLLAHIAGVIKNASR